MNKMHAETQYLQILKDLISSTDNKYANRTGVDTYKIPPRMIQHDMSLGFPIMTTKFVAWKTLRVELEGFIKGITSKSWFQDRGCKIWDEWCNPQQIPYSTDSKVQELMAAEDDLGPCIYGGGWRNFHDPAVINIMSDSGQHIDQLKNIVQTLKSNPQDRRMICLAWNPLGLKHAALPACHTMWQVTVRGNKLDLTWTQRSVDTFLGLPFNIASYGLLLHLLAKESGLEPGILSGSLCDLHLYENHIDQAKEQLSRTPYDLPEIQTNVFDNIFDWEWQTSVLHTYKYHPSIKAPVAV